MPQAVVIPAYNEAASLAAVVDEVRASCPAARLVVVDDASDDATPDLLPRLGVAWLRLPCRLGTGGAVRAGLRFALATGDDTVVRLDGDGQHRATEVGILLAALAAGADAAHGSRYLADPDGGYRTPGVRRSGQRLLAAALGGLLGRRVTDPTSGFWAFGPRATRLLARHHPGGYPEPELLLFLHRNRLTTVEVPVVMRRRAAGRSSFTFAREATALARVLLAMLIVPRRAAVEVRA